MAVEGRDTKRELDELRLRHRESQDRANKAIEQLIKDTEKRRSELQRDKDRPQ